VPRLEIRWDGDRIGQGGLELRRHLLEGEPRIMLDDRDATEGSVFILPFSLQPGEAGIVGERIRDALMRGVPEETRAAATAPAASVAGQWRVTIDFVRGQAVHALDLRQDGARLDGIHRTAELGGAVTGAVEDGRITLRSAHRFQGTNLVYSFTGTVSDGRMEGAVALGTDGTSAPGPLNRREFGDARWSAVRRD
jgi:hypothetical protein